jgi:diguanylate cyclase (GGDEF)-like protein
MSRQNRGLVRANAANAENAKRLAFLAHHDALTALPNRTAFNAAFEVATATAGDRHARFAVLAVDLDGFKAINDSLGHAAGDALLSSVADRLRNAIAGDPRNVVARFGGDEFVILLHLPAGASAVERANRLRDLLRNPHDTGTGPVVVDATIGVAVSGADRQANLRLPLDADLALTQAKFDGKGTILAFGPEMRRSTRRRVRLETDLEAALRAGVIQPYYQPQVDLVSGRVVGVEALARWQHPDLGCIAPDEFIPVAEASGQISDIGHAILETACRDALLLPADIPVSVNLSVMQLVGDDSVDKLLDLIKRSGLSSRRLTFEVTESTVMKDADRALAALARVKQHGIKIALDDFGMGYSALSYLRSFAWDELKIDRSFVQSMCHDPHSYSIVETVISLAHKLGIQVIAEGVEDAAQLQLLRTAGCKAAQGFLFSRPVASEDLGQAFLNCMSASAPRSPRRRREASASGQSRPPVRAEAVQRSAQLPAGHRR